MAIIRIGKRYKVTKSFDGKEFRLHDSYKYKRDAQKEADRLSERDFNYRIVYKRSKRGYNRYELYIRK